MKTEDFTSPNGWFDFKSYLESVGASSWLRKDEILLLLKEARFCHSSRSSFVDSLLRRVVVSVSDDYDVAITLLGPFFDRAYFFSFSGVSTLRLPEIFSLGESVRRIVVYEAGGVLSFEISLKDRRDLVIEVACDGFSFREVLMDRPFNRNEGLSWAGEWLSGKTVFTVSSNPTNGVQPE